MVRAASGSGATLLIVLVLPLAGGAQPTSVSIFPDSLGPGHEEAERDLDELRDPDQVPQPNPDATSSFFDPTANPFGAQYVPFDGVLTVYPESGTNATLHIAGFDTNAILEDTITAAELRCKFSVEDQPVRGEFYNGTRSVRYDSGGGFVNTTILPFAGDIDQVETFDLFAAGVGTIAQLADLDVDFVNNSANTGPPAYGPVNGVSFDSIRLDVTYDQTTAMDVTAVTVEQYRDYMGRTSEGVVLHIEVEAVGGLARKALTDLTIQIPVTPSDHLVPDGVRLYYTGASERLDLDSASPISTRSPTPSVTFSGLTGTTLNHRTNHFWVTFTPSPTAPTTNFNSVFLPPLDYRPMHAYIASESDVTFSPADASFSLSGGSSSSVGGSRDLIAFAAHAEHGSGGMVLGAGQPIVNGLGKLDQTDWQIGRPDLFQETEVTDDRSLDGPGHVFGTDIATEYAIRQDVVLTSPTIDLSDFQCSQGIFCAEVWYWHSTGFEGDQFLPSFSFARDGYIVQLSDDGVVWNDIPFDGDADVVINPYDCGAVYVVPPSCTPSGGCPAGCAAECFLHPDFLNPLSIEPGFTCTSDDVGRHAFFRENVPDSIPPGVPHGWTLIPIGFPQGSRYLTPSFKFRIRMGTDSNAAVRDEEGVLIDSILVFGTTPFSTPHVPAMTPGALVALALLLVACAAALYRTRAAPRA